MADQDSDGVITWVQLQAEVAATLSSPQEARWIIERASGYDASERLAHRDDPVSIRSLAFVDKMVARRRAGAPIQYALGLWAFRTLELLVDERVLIPRPETEFVVEVALGIAHEIAGTKHAPITALDLGTGSGAIALSLADEMPFGAIDVWATDVSADALEVATANLAGLGRPATRVRMVQSDWFDALPVELKGGIDLVVANPPYIANGDPDVDESVEHYEPHVALYSGPTGLECIERILRDALDQQWLAPRGVIVMEIGAGQGDAATRSAAALGYSGIEIRRDLADRERVLIARR
ncbi:MAG: peptide chain release factor N(5)-glutamine methyltransferase [Acidimicrobiia bacterium]